MKKFTKRDFLIGIEKKWQKKWQESNAYQVDAPSSSTSFPRKKFLTFPFPYMNGKLHLGHAFSISKAEFAARFYRMKGYRVLFPFAFHGTGMPIVSCAMRLSKELGSSVESAETANSIQSSILMDMGISASDLVKFTDPNYWLDYFPPLAIV